MFTLSRSHTAYTLKSPVLKIAITSKTPRIRFVRRLRTDFSPPFFVLFGKFFVFHLPVRCKVSDPRVVKTINVFRVFKRVVRPSRWLGRLFTAGRVSFYGKMIARIRFRLRENLLYHTESLSFILCERFFVSAQNGFFTASQRRSRILVRAPNAQTCFEFVFSHGRQNRKTITYPSSIEWT